METRKYPGWWPGLALPARSEVREGEVLDGEIITSPASLITGEAATAAAEQEVPMTADHLRVGGDLSGAGASAFR